jgi:cytochrome c553
MKIVLSALVALFLLGCNENKSTTNESKSVAPTKSKVVEKVAVVEKKVAPVAKAEAPKTKKVVAQKVDAAKLFVSCSSCHGTHAEKKALGKSHIIAGWKASKIETALKGYQDGSYGGAMKGVMKAQASKLTNKEITALAEYISKL